MHTRFILDYSEKYIFFKRYAKCKKKIFLPVCLNTKVLAAFELRSVQNYSCASLLCTLYVLPHEKCRVCMNEDDKCCKNLLFFFRFRFSLWG